jgi:hypothetical protein
MYLCEMNQVKYFFLCALMLVALTTCDNESADKKKNFDYFQFQELNLAKYDIQATIMIPDATAGIGASFKPEVKYDEGGYKWSVSVGRNFQLFIEDYGDNLYRFAEFKKDLLKDHKKTNYFQFEMLKEEKDVLVYSRKEKSNFVKDKKLSYHIYAVKKINGIYYEIQNRELGDSKKVIDFMYHSIQSFQP